MSALILDGKPFAQPLGKVVCVGRNYAEHARELNNPVPDKPLLFMKPASAVCALSEDLLSHWEGEPLHYESELALLIGKPLSAVSPEEALSAVTGLGLALDLTRRQTQSELKSKGHPWELAKAFDRSCPLSDFFSPSEGFETHTRFELQIDGERRQLGQVSDMIVPIADLLAYMSRCFSLVPGDVVLTGTPAGVGVLMPGQSLQLSASFGLEVVTQVR